MNPLLEEFLFQSRSNPDNTIPDQSPPNVDEKYPNQFVEENEKLLRSTKPDELGNLPRLACFQQGAEKAATTPGFQCDLHFVKGTGLHFEKWYLYHSLDKRLVLIKKSTFSENGRVSFIECPGNNPFLFLQICSDD